MVKIAIAGGTGTVALEIIDALVAAERHEIWILSRKDTPDIQLPAGVKWAKVSYDDVDQLAKSLDGFETVLSFITEMYTDKPIAQRNLIDAAVKAGVKRFAPSEWSVSHFEHMANYRYKEDSRKYLEELNKEKKVLEYCLFQPGLFTNYFTFPHKSSEHFYIFEMPINFEKRRALIREGGEDDVITFTTTQDLAHVVAQAVEYEGEWPVTGGIQGKDLTISQFIALGEKIRGPFEVEKLSNDNLKAGVLGGSWMPTLTRPVVPEEERKAVANALFSGFLLSIQAGAWRVTDEWNKLLPDHQFDQPEEFLGKAWAKVDASAPDA